MVSMSTKEVGPPLRHGSVAGWQATRSDHLSDTAISMPTSAPEGILPSSKILGIHAAGTPQRESCFFSSHPQVSQGGEGYYGLIRGARGWNTLPGRVYEKLGTTARTQAFSFSGDPGRAG